MSRRETQRMKDNATEPGSGGALQRKSAKAPSIVHEVLRSPGQPLDPATRELMEPRFSHDFSRVRIHADARAAESAQAVGALAYTVGQDVVFAGGRYQPADQEGRRLLAHELTHTLQQGNARPAAALDIAAPDHPAENEANRAAGAVAAASVAGPLATRVSALLQRQAKPGASTAPSTAPPAASAPTPAQIYQQALPKVKTLDPAIFNLLSKATLGGGPQLVLTETTPGPSGAQPIVIEVKLESKLGSLPATKDAEMQTAPRSVPDPAAKKFELLGVMTVNSTMASITPDALAQILVHEGIHFQIATDKLVSPQNQSAHAGSFGKYIATAKSLPSRSTLRAQLDLYMEKVLKSKNQPTDSTARFKDASKILDLIVEEKYVYDQDKKRGAPARSNRTIGNDYVVDGLDAIGIPPSVKIQPDLGNVITLAEKFLNDLDVQLNPPAAPPSQSAPPPSGSGKPPTPP
jgi:hypothetical protein